MIFWLVSCNSGYNRNENKKIVKDMLSEFLMAVEENDYDKLQKVVHEDFVIYENGSVWDLTRFSTELENFQNVEVKYKLRNLHTIVDENVAHLQFLNKGKFVYPDTTIVLDFIESATFVRDESSSKWSLRFYHSTHLKRDNNLKSNKK